MDKQNDKTKGKTGNPIGRPKKTNEPKAVGRPRDPKKAMQAFRDRILNAHRSEKVIDAIFQAALDPEHKNQAAAWHIIMDRLAPKRLFENEVEGANNAGNAIQVTITTAGGDVNIGQSETDNDPVSIDADFTVVEPEEVPSE